MIDWNMMTTEQLVAEWHERGNTDPKRDEILAECHDRCNRLYREQADLYDELERTEDYHTSQDIERGIERIDEELFSMRSVFHEADTEQREK